MRTASRALILAILLAAAPARAGWRRTTFTDSAGNPATPPQRELKSVGAGAPVAGQPAWVWAVGGTAGASFIVFSDDGFDTVRQLSDCDAAITSALNTVWVAPDAGAVHAFGMGTAHALWDGAWSCSPFTATGGATGINVYSAALADRDDGYLVGSATLPSPAYLARWSAGSAAFQSTSVSSTLTAIARAPASGRYVFSSGARLFRVGGTGSFYTGPSSFTAIAFFGDAGVAVAATAAGCRLLDAASDIAWEPSGAPIDFEPVKGVSMPSASFVVAVGALDATRGAVAQSLDGGNTWQRVDLSGISPDVRVLGSVTCWDPNHCAAVGGADDGSALQPELLVYENLPPDGTITVNGLAPPGPVKDDADVCVEVTGVADPEGETPVSIQWSGAPWLTGSASSVCMTPERSCAAQTLDNLSLVLADSRTSQTKEFSIQIEHEPLAPQSLALTPAPTSGDTYEWQLGQSHTLAASATGDCGHGVSYHFAYAGSPALQPALDDAQGTAVFDLAGCLGGAGTLTVTATDPVAPSAPAATLSYDVVVPDAPDPRPQIALSPGTDLPVPVSGSRTVQVEIVSHCSGTDPSGFDFEWDCQPGQTQSSAVFTNPGDPCGPSRLDCTVTVVPKGLDPATAAASLPFTVTMERPAPSLTFEVENGSGPGSATIPAHGTVTVTPRPQGLCNPTLAWACTCTGAGCVSPDPGNAASWELGNPDPPCGAAGYHCTVIARGADGTEVAQDISLSLEQADAVTVAQVVFDPAAPAAPLAEGESVTATVSASNQCAGAFTWTWTCAGMASPDDGTTVVAFRHPGDTVCADQVVECIAQATDAAGVYPPGEVRVSLTYAHVEPEVRDLALAPLIREGDEIVAVASVHARCAQPHFSWEARLQSSQAVYTQTGPGSEFRFTPELCGTDTVRVTVEEQTFGLNAESSLSVSGAGAAPIVYPPTSASYEPSREPVLDCASPAPVVLRPAVSSPLGCGLSHRWRQVSGPAVDTVQGPAGELEIRAAPGALGALLGRSAQFELIATNLIGDSPPVTFEVSFQPARFVILEHRADRRVASVGEPVGLTLDIATDCAASLDAAVDVHLSLRGLELVAGSARYDGAALADPEKVGSELVFRGLGVPAAQEPARRLSYTARRTRGAGASTSRALAYLSASPGTLVSEPASSGNRDGGGGVPALGCDCAEAGTGQAAWIAALGAIGLAGRLRRRSC